MTNKPQPLRKTAHQLLIKPPRDSRALKSPIHSHHAVERSALAFLYELRAVAGFRSDDWSDGGEGLEILAGWGTGDGGKGGWRWVAEQV